MRAIEAYIDKCLLFAEENDAYFMYVNKFDNYEVEPEMLREIDSNLFSGKPDKAFFTQEGRQNILIRKGTEKDKFWKPVENNIRDEEIRDMEMQLNCVLPISYKHYLKYKHYYKIFWDIDIILFAKPKNCWKQILLSENNKVKEIVLDNGYFAIGKYSDYGLIALKLGSNETEELEVVWFDFETGEVGETLAENFIELLEQILRLNKPGLRELKEFEKKLSIYK